MFITQLLQQLYPLTLLSHSLTSLTNSSLVTTIFIYLTPQIIYKSIPIQHYLVIDINLLVIIAHRPTFQNNFILTLRPKVVHKLLTNSVPKESFRFPRRGHYLAHAFCKASMLKDIEYLEVFGVVAVVANIPTQSTYLTHLYLSSQYNPLLSYPIAIHLFGPRYSLTPNDIAQ